jgi:hypothetical protein
MFTGSLDLVSRVIRLKVKPTRRIGGLPRGYPSRPRPHPPRCNRKLSLFHLFTLAIRDAYRVPYLRVKQ